MEELNKFLRFLKKNILLVIILPIVTVIITFFLVRNLPGSYVSQAEIATGIVDETKQTSIFEKELQAQQIVQEFNNLIALMKMSKVVNQVSYQLLIHDLSTSAPFRPLSKQISQLSPTEKRIFLDSLKSYQESKKSLSLYNPTQKRHYDLIKSMKYDAESLKEHIQVFRAGDSDFIVVTADSEDSELSAFVVNKLAEEFISYYTTAVKSNKYKTTELLRDLLTQKSDTLLKRMNNLRDYKVQNRVLNLDEQSKQLYSQIIDYNNKRQEAIQKTSSYAGALDEIDAKFSPKERKYLESALSGINQRIVATKSEISQLYDLYYKSDLDEKYKRSIDSLGYVLQQQIAKSSDAYITNPLNAKESLITEKINLEVQLDISRYSINSLERELKKLNGQFDELVPREADVQKFEMDVDIASKEYLDILNKYNQSTLETSFEVKLNVVQPAIPGLLQPSKKMLLVILSGVISLVMVLLGIFVVYYLDDSILSAKDLANATQVPVLGALSTLPNNNLNLADIWANKNNLKSNTEFKQQLRSARYEIESEIKGKLIILTSIDPGEGKTLLAQSLGFAWKMTNHKVLLIDGNFAHPELSQNKETILLEDFIQGKAQISVGNVEGGSVFILGNKGGDTALLELAPQEQIQNKINELKQLFDIILVETSALDGMNQTKEWMLFGDGVVSVFKAGTTITESRKTLINQLKESPLFKGWIINKVLSKDI